MQLVLELVNLHDVQRLDHQQCINKKTIALMSRDAPGRSMGTGDKTHFLKVSHHVSNRGGA
jgi:hypothetical protein